MNTKRNEKGYPLLEDGRIDWELTAEEKANDLEYLPEESGKKKHRRKPTNIFPKKKKRK